MGILQKLFGPPSRKSFAAMVMRELETQGAGPLRFNETTFAVEIGGGRLYLQNFYARFAAARTGDRYGIAVETARQWIARPAGKPRTFEEARAMLRPSVRSRAYYDASNLKMEAEGIPHRIEPFGTLGAHLALGLVLDFPDSIELVSSGDLQSWNATYGEAFEIAKDNLRDASIRSFESRNGLYVSTWDDAYDATRILLPEFIKPLQVRGSHVALLPHRNLLLVAGSEDPAALMAMADVARETLGQPQPISAFPLLLLDGEWTDWQIPRDHPAGNAFRLLQIQRLAEDYDEQQNLLRGAALRRGEDLFVASFQAMRRKDTAELITLTSWTEGTTALLPEAGEIAFVKLPDAVRRVRWQEVMRVAPELLEPTDHYPPRWKVTAFPTESQLAEMKAEET